MAEDISQASGSLPLGPLDPSVIHHGPRSEAAPVDKPGSGSNTKGGDTNNSTMQLSPMFNVLIAGGVGGAVGDSSMYPLDTVKTRQQAAPNVVKYRTMMRATLSIVKEEGIFRGIYSGYLPALLGSFPSTMAFFGTYETTKRTLILDYDAPETLSHLTAGLLGDLASSFIYVPSEVLKTRLQLQGRYNNPHFYSGYNYRGTFDAFRTIVRNEGVGAMFYGYKATLVRDLPFSALQLAFYEKFHAAAQQLVGPDVDMGIGLELATGALAGGLAGVITTPLDVVKTRVQTQHPEVSGGISHMSNSIWGGLRKIYATEGLSVMFSGVGPRLVWTSVQSSIMLLIYQTTLKMMDSRSGGKALE